MAPNTDNIQSRHTSRDPDQGVGVERGPVVVVLGHVDHGKSTLLDYIRKTNVTETEAGGITQHVAAYEVVRKDEEGRDRRITFIDTPGHAAFGAMRRRGASVADIAVLVVAADDGVKPQTKEAYEAIVEACIPFIVAISKIDKPGASVDRAKQSLSEMGVFVEGYGGTVPVVEIDSKVGTGIDNLLIMVLLTASLEGLTYQPTSPAKGVVIESHRGARRGTLSTLIVHDGTLRNGDCVVIGKSVTSIRTLSDWSGETAEEIEAGRPAVAGGFATLPSVGDEFVVCPNKYVAQDLAEKNVNTARKSCEEHDGDKEICLPVVVKADTAGSLDALITEIKKHETEKIGIKIVSSAVGKVAESDVKVLIGSQNPTIVCFNVSADKYASDLAEKNGVPIVTFNIIYKLTEWLDEHISKLSPIEKIDVVETRAKVLKNFSRSKNKQMLGGVVLEGELSRGKQLIIKRGDEEVGIGKLASLQRGRVDAEKVAKGEQFGAIIDSHTEIAEGDELQIIKKG